MNPVLETSQTWDNLVTFFMWLVAAIIVLAFVVLGRGIKQAVNGKKVDKGMIPFVKWPLLFASAGFNVFFTYYVFLPAGLALTVTFAVVMGGVNLAEAYLVRLIIAAWRHGLILIYRIALVLTIPVFLYSLMAAGSSYSTMMNKNNDVQMAASLHVEAAKDRIKEAEAKVVVANNDASGQNVLKAIYETNVTNTLGAKVSFNEVKNSCLSGGYYANKYPALCRQYQQLNNGDYAQASVADAKVDALKVSATQKEIMAQTITDRPPVISPTLLGLSVSIAVVGFIVSLALESAIIGVGFFEELFIKPTPLPARVRFQDKAIDWDVSAEDRLFNVEVSPSPGTVSLEEAYTPLIPSDAGTEGLSPSLPSDEGTEGLAPSVPSGEGGEKDVSDYFTVWLDAVKKKDIAPTVKPTTRWISKRINVGSIIEIEQLAKDWLSDAKDMGVIMDNPKRGVGRAMYILVE